MQIGEFASLCGTKISVLRHYDKEGLLSPDYVDRFTGYRYYAKEQIPVFFRITALKKAGFSLPEIRTLLKAGEEELLSLFESKREELTKAMESLREARDLLLGETRDMSVVFTDYQGSTVVKSRFDDGNLQNQLREEVEDALHREGYQRISTHRTYGEPGSNRVYVACDAVKLKDKAEPIWEDTNVLFEDDPSVVGKWQTVGEYAVKEDFYGGVCPRQPKAREICFLPGGEQYWCYAWSKGKLICRFGDSAFVNDYTLEEYGGQRYMFVTFKSYEYRRGGRPTVLVLCQIDDVAYRKEELARKDEVDLPFVEDPSVLGKWIACDFGEDAAAYDPEELPRKDLFFKTVEFKAGGEVISRYGNEVICGDHMQTWTKGYVLRKWNHTACAYEIRTIGGRDYLFMEWKSGDYLYGGAEPGYYVFARV